MKYKRVYTSNYGFEYQGICFDGGGGGRRREALIEKIRFRTAQTWKAQNEPLIIN